MSKIRIKINPDHPTRVVPDPNSGDNLDPTLEHEVEDSVYWRRRLQSADIVLVQEKSIDDKVEKKTGKAGGKNKPPIEENEDAEDESNEDADGEDETEETEEKSQPASKDKKQAGNAKAAKTKKS